MNCLINEAIDKYLRRGKRIDVIRRYIKMKYRINIDTMSIKQRIKALKVNYELG